MGHHGAGYAKITRPQILDVYPRRRLFRLLQEHLEQGSVWVQGPAGAGKTTLVSSYLDHHDVPCLWYHFDERDAEVGRFFHYLREAVEAATEGQGPPLPALTPEYLLDLPTFARNFFECLYRRLDAAHAGPPRGFCTLVFDDYHLIDAASPLHAIMKIALSELAGDIRMILLSRQPMPQELALMHANRRLAVIGWDELRLLPDETRGILRCLWRRRGAKGMSEALHARAQGWVAGLILLLEQARRGERNQSGAFDISPSLQDYFSETLFEGLDARWKDFLLKSALLPFMDEGMAAGLTGCDDAGQILESLYHHNFFLEKRGGVVATYRYHALFREFLLAHGEQVLAPGDLAALRQQAGRILLEAGYAEEAAALFQGARDWEALARLIMAEAQALLMQGRGESLLAWLVSIPESRMHSNPWLQYWLGACKLHRLPHEARHAFESAYERFAQCRDRHGQYLAWAGIVESAFVIWEFRFLDRWIAEMERLLAEGEPFPSPEIQGRVTVAMFLALMFREPWHEKIGVWAERLAQCIEACEDREQKLMLALHLIPYYSWLGELDRMNALLGSVRPFSFDGLRPLACLQYWISEAYCAWFMAEGPQALEAVEQGLETGKASGVRVLDALLCSQGVYGALSQGDLARGRACLDRMRAATEETHRTNSAHYYHLVAWLAALNGRRDEAIRHLRTSLALAEQDGTVFPIACNHVELAGLLLEAGMSDEAEVHLRAAREIGGRMGSLTMDIKCRLVQARMDIQRGRERAAVRQLRHALATARARGFVNLPWWYPPAMAALCVKAMEHGIEVDYVRDLVRRRALVPAAPPVHLPDWPWPLKIYTLGRFAVIKEGEPLKFSGKGQKMPLALLKTLLALGGRSVPEEKITEVLWPSSEMESAHSAFATNLSRLRRLLGDAELLQLHEGRLTLDPRRCWVDVWSFERAAGKNAVRQDKLEPRQADRAMQLYGGGFLADEEGESYAILSMRERLREKYLHLVERLGAYHMERGAYQSAVACFEQGLAEDDLVESFYCNLMRCYERLGQRSRALQCYRRCQRILSSRFGIAPARETEAMYRRLLAEEHGELRE
ncbi:MAG TPA: hypothetical protein ENK48_06510 [Gammaproteobacteria bacterium]|nr:hypothetical protein [Gammaproteobacteria bacterium]